MKLFNAIALLAGAIAAVYASGGEADNEITFYGCPEECYAQRKPSCSQFDEDDLPTYFAALSTKLDNYEDYCGKYAVYMISDGSNVKKLAKATVVDSCSSCAEYHLDLSKPAFEALRDEDKGTAKVIWGIFSKKGEKVAGPWYNSVSGSAKKLGMSKEEFISAFIANAKSLAASSHGTATFSKDLRVNKTTTSKKVVTTIPAVKTVTVAAKTVQAGAVTPAQTKQVAKPEAKKEDKPKVADAVSEEKDEKSNVGALLAVGGGVLGAAGVGLLFMKKKNPNTYEDLKQKFPEAFTTVKRGLTRSATSIKRRVTTSKPKNYSRNIAVASEV